LSDPGAFIRPNFRYEPALADSPRANFGAGWEPAGYRRERGSRVYPGPSQEQKGNPTCETSFSPSRTLFVLPEGYRPGNGQVFDVELGNGHQGRVDVLADGQVRCEYGEASSYLSLGGITFAAGS
jgi:hypothetical protein